MIAWGLDGFKLENYKYIYILYIYLIILYDQLKSNVGQDWPIVGWMTINHISCFDHGTCVDTHTFFTEFGGLESQHVWWNRAWFLIGFNTYVKFILRLSPVAVFTTRDGWMFRIHALVTAINQQTEFNISMEDHRPLSSINGPFSSIYHSCLKLPDGNMNCTTMISLCWWNVIVHRHMFMCATLLYRYHARL